MSQRLSDMAAAWNSAPTAFSAIKMNVTDTASAAESNLFWLGVGGINKFRVRKDGLVDMGAVLNLDAPAGLTGAATVEVRVDEFNPSVSALYLLPPINAGRVFIGDATRTAFQLNLVHCSGLAGLANLELSNQLFWGGSHSIARVGQYLHFRSGAPSPGNTGYQWYTDKAEDSFDANDLVLELTGPGAFRGYSLFSGGGANYERWALQSGSGYFEWAAETAGTGADNIDLRLTPAGTGRVRFGTHTALGAETVTGYITIKDAGGTERKIAVVSP